jgi:hypothetical protein
MKRATEAMINHPCFVTLNCGHFYAKNAVFYSMEISGKKNKKTGMHLLLDAELHSVTWICEGSNHLFNNFSSNFSTN